MMRVSSLAALVAAAACASGATRRLPPGDAGEGAKLFRSLGCGACHRAGGEGGGSKPDLARSLVPGLVPSDLAAAMWNHDPDHLSAGPREMTPQQAAGLFAFLFAVLSWEGQGDARRGRRAFRDAQCARCHAGAGPGGGWSAFGHPLVLAQRHWNHVREVGEAVSRERIPFPRLTAPMLADVAAYLRAPARDAPVLLPGPPAEGAEVFKASRCPACHRGVNSLEGRRTRYTLNHFAAKLWNHPELDATMHSPLTPDEMRRLAGFLISGQFEEEYGNPGIGERLYRKKGCGQCHGPGASEGPDLKPMAGRMTTYHLAAAAWKHGAAMQKAMRARGIRRPRLTGAEAADLSAFLHGYEFKRRETAPAR
jgi:mono/diheme cytochrome c family protein